MSAIPASVAAEERISGLGKQLGWRWAKFNLVGGAGIVVQLAVLWLLLHGLRCNYLWATALAVETTVLHNFFWHQRFTWADRAYGHMRDTAFRLLRFNLTNGAVSIGGNVLLMGLLVGGFHLQALLANGVSIAACSLANFLLSENFVFRVSPG